MLCFTVPEERIRYSGLRTPSTRFNMEETAHTSDKDDMDGYCRVSSVQTKDGKKILQSMALHFPVSAVTAILGPSGSGEFPSCWNSNLGSKSQ